LKVLDAFASGVPMVAHPVACEGIAVQDGRHVLLASEPDSYATKIFELMKDEGMRRRLGYRGTETGRDTLQLFLYRASAIRGVLLHLQHKPGGSRYVRNRWLLPAHGLAPSPLEAPDVADLPAVLKHRGPDSHGSWYSDRQDIYFFHSRLAIQDLSPLGHQPMISRCGRFCITFNGEIYNFNDLSVHLNRRCQRCVATRIRRS
jgi:hypothetical protein